MPKPQRSGVGAAKSIIQAAPKLAKNTEQDSEEEDEDEIEPTERGAALTTIITQNSIYNEEEEQFQPTIQMANQNNILHSTNDDAPSEEALKKSALLRWAWKCALSSEGKDAAITTVKWQQETNGDSTKIAIF